jgi:hypothetical protein
MLSNRLGFIGHNEISPLLTLYGYVPNKKVNLVSFNIMYNSFRPFNVKTAYAVQRLKVTNIEFHWNKLRHQWPHLSDIDPINVDSSDIGVLLGRNVLRLHDVIDTCYPANGIEAPDGIKTHFGWCIPGPVSISTFHPFAQIKSQSVNNPEAGFYLSDVSTHVRFIKPHEVVTQPKATRPA